jgi:UDP-glucose 4-epimerase
MTTMTDPVPTGKKWLFLGGAGYIGSHVLREFLAAGENCVVLDNLVTGKVERIPPQVELLQCDATNAENIAAACKSFEITGVVHLAAFMQARESVADPIKYWKNNLGVSLALAKVLNGSGIKHVIFSSSCSVYGNAQNATEVSAFNPISPYAMTKVASEQVLTQSAAINEVQLTVLRYFNVIGCGEFEKSFDHGNETILPAAARKITAGVPPVIFGDNFLTKDGSALRDYLDVRDLARAHLLVACRKANLNPMTMNVSSGRAVSVKEIVSTLLDVSGSELTPTIVPSKPGDPSEIWACESPELKSLGWNPTYSLYESVLSFWNAFKKSTQ